MAPSPVGVPGTAKELFDFIPVVAYRKVLDAHADAVVSVVPSYRRVRLETMYESENDFGVHLRESNSTFRETVQVGCVEIIGAVAVQVVGALVVGIDQEHIRGRRGRCRGRFGLSHE